MNKLPIETPLLGIHGIGPGFLKRLTKLDIETVRDLLWHFPTRYEDFSEIYKIADLEPGQQATIQGTIDDIQSRQTWKRHMAIVEVFVSDGSDSIRAVWFNQPYIANTLRPGRVANFSGKVSVSDEGEIYLSNPAYEVLSGNEQEDMKHTARLVPIYPETQGLTSRGLRFLVQPVLKNLEHLQEWLPDKVLEANDFPEINNALINIHFPKKIEDALDAKKRFEFEDLFLLQLYNLQQKLKLAKEKAPIIKTNLERLKNIISELPFKLTASQKRSLWEIIQDLEKPRPMNRLLQGDVGSGKTVVAVLAAMMAAENGLQTAFMAPTEVLAKQHFETLRKLFKKIGSDSQPTAGLITANDAGIIRETDDETSIKKTDLQKKVKNGEIKIVIGTHALLQKSVKFNNLGLVIIDEQHRFGVNQRAILTRHDKNEPTNDKKDHKKSTAKKPSWLVPHFLSMSATPIPRTLMMTIFGDLDISTITELPTGRKNIITKIVPPAKRVEAYKFIRSQARENKQIFVICPRIDPAQNNDGKMNSSAGNTASGSSYSPNKATLWDVKSVKEEYEKLSKKVFPDLKVTMLHGKIKASEKGKIMSDFRAGRGDILVSTSVIEVGVDVPNATIMMIEGSDRFGLAQLYQFRGRVGRSKYQSYCFLFTDSESKTTAERLHAIVEAKNGFELAEHDLKIRGPGEFLGKAQTGIPDFAMMGLQNIELVKSSRDAAVQILKSDTSLNKYPSLKTKLARFENRIHLE